MLNENKHELSIWYDIPLSGYYEHDLLADELAGPKAKTTSFGSLMFRSRSISYAFLTEDDLDEAAKRFVKNNLFRIYQHEKRSC